MRILLVEDDLRLAETLAEALTDQRYVVDIVTDGESGWHQAKMLNYDLLLLDLMLPELDGISLCHRLRSHGYTMPVLMITARDTLSDEINGLDAGADDYVVKPVDLQKLFARIRALLRRGNSTSGPILEWEEIRLNPSTYEVTYGQAPLHLTPKEYALLELLLRNGRRVLSRSVMIEHVWSLESPPEENTVKVHIRSLRQKLKAAGAAEDLIETVHSMGYRLKQSDSTTNVMKTHLELKTTGFETVT
ncbi:MAG: response regulator transcription factor [Microcoleus sp. PH2017_10_PVI_O_A]|uniref:response regulator transcription factor n=1 Tax=unclassified Microcoleus TaxID=2642155 RepID=UPI001D9EB0A6|nr:MULTISPECIES: response regulator transcription factor [unclassified Microcoleus]TAE81408.1 MAG: DNA-binding response regulator [Oscillatoriales cyanobacterium]MCC3407199.1 response regulator transcription factor [Microcoleus sp. PH2017_10_PVI_O_A]MCC3461203.1 response regulator transcription factor [Microcoleus sp. PH2017_11_PCY_U_A]MCC3479730.1 response regulator transcription factor [Microcoleus sp. PH2017_12_PCY_D_A]MCC3529702.1 response regulator transcription factor [Microcoleus sp. PH